MDDLSVTTGPIIGSKKAYIKGRRFPDIRVPVREIKLEESSGEPPFMVRRGRRAHGRR